MIRRLIILLFIVGCDSRTENNETNSIIGFWNAIEIKTARNRFLFIEDLNIDFEVLQLKTRNISNTTEEVTTIVLALAISVIFQ